MSGQLRLTIPKLEMSPYIQVFLTQLVNGMLLTDWWKRPSTRDILNALSSLTDDRSRLNFSPGLVYGNEHESNVRTQSIVEWRPYWYDGPYSALTNSGTCGVAVKYHEVDINQHLERPAFLCDCRETLGKVAIWKFVVQ